MAARFVISLPVGVQRVVRLLGQVRRVLVVGQDGGRQSDLSQQETVDSLQQVRRDGSSEVEEMSAGVDISDQPQSQAGRPQWPSDHSVQVRLVSRSADVSVLHPAEVNQGEVGGGQEGAWL